MTVSLTDIEHALERLSGAALRTPLLRCAELSERTGASVLIKPENLQHIGAFKFRGAYNRIQWAAQAITEIKPASGPAL